MSSCNCNFCITSNCVVGLPGATEPLHDDKTTNEHDEQHGVVCRRKRLDARCTTPGGTSCATTAVATGSLGGSRLHQASSDRLSHPERRVLCNGRWAFDRRARLLTCANQNDRRPRTTLGTASRGDRPPAHQPGARRRRPLLRTDVRRLSRPANRCRRRTP
jgi:hypothetical protein